MTNTHQPKKRRLKKWVIPAAVTALVVLLALIMLIVSALVKSVPKATVDKVIGFSFIDGGKYGLMDTNGDILIPAKYDAPIGDFHSGLAAVCSDGKFGYIDTTGKYIINPQYTSAYDFSNGMAAFLDETSQLYGYINTTGEVVITPRYQKCGVFAEGIAPVLVDTKWIYVDKKGKQAFAGEFTYASAMTEKLAVVEKEGKIGYIDRKGKLVLDYQPYTYAGNFFEGRAAVRNQAGKYGFINEKGELIAPFEYDAANEFSEGLAAVQKNGKWGFINKSGLIQIDFFDCAEVGSFTNGRSFVTNSDMKSAIMDKSGKILTSYQFSEQYTRYTKYSDGLARVSSETAAGYIDIDGKYIINPQFEYASEFINGRALVVSGGKVGVIDKSGKYILEPRWEIADPSFGYGRPYEPVKEFK